MFIFSNLSHDWREFWRLNYPALLWRVNFYPQKCVKLIVPKQTFFAPQIPSCQNSNALFNILLTTLRKIEKSITWSLKSYWFWLLVEFTGKENLIIFVIFFPFEDFTLFCDNFMKGNSHAINFLKLYFE